MGDSRSTLVHDVRNQLSGMLMLISLLEKVELTSDIHVRLSASAAEFRKVLTEPDLGSGTHHDLDTVLDAFLEVLTDVEKTQLPEEFVSLRADVVARIPMTSALWASLTQL